MDFPERLAGRVNSRMGNHRLVFSPYTYEQIRMII
jgi:Cdc6-like AAA superfamily ATPase